MFSSIRIGTENNKKNSKFPLYDNDNLSSNLLKINAIECNNLPEIPQSTPTKNSNFSLTKNSSHRETISYICGLRARIECEPLSEHSTRSDRVTNIGYRLPVGASVLLTQITIYPATLFRLPLLTQGHLLPRIR